MKQHYKFKFLLKFAPYLIWFFFAYFCYFYAVEILHGGHGWKTADWLINFDSGLVRRGLIGSLILLISDLIGGLLWVTFFIQAFIYALIYFFILQLYTSIPRTSFWLLILFSPAFILFPYYDLLGGFRKEIIVFLSFVLFCKKYREDNLTIFWLSLISFIFALSAFSHELTAFVVTYFLYLLLLSYRSGKISQDVMNAYAGIFLLICFSAIIFALNFKGDVTTSSKLCLSLLSKGLTSDICSGAISWLGDDLGIAHQKVLSDIRYASLYSPLLFYFGILPTIATNWWRVETCLLVAVSILIFSPLFVFALDWGRWIHIQVFFIVCLVLTENVSVKSSFKNITSVLGIIYLFTWSIPHCCVGGLGFGFIQKTPLYLRSLSSDLYVVITQ